MLTPRQRHPSLLSVLSAHGILALVIFLAAFTAAQGANADWAPGANPVNFVGFESSKAGKDDLELALGDILNGKQYQAVEIWTTLLLGNTTLINLPEDCRAGENQSNKLDSVSLTYVYGQNGAFTKTYLGIGAPNRYYSLTTLSQLVLLPAPERTLRLKVSNLAIWSSLTADMKTALIYDTVNKTLEKVLRNVTFSKSTALDGTLFVRNVSQTRQGKGGLTFVLPYLFFSVDKFSQCVRRGPVSQVGGIVLCTHFSPIEDPKFYPWVLYFAGCMLIFTFVILSIAIGCGVWKGEFPFYREYCGKLQHSGARPKLDGSFPSSLSISATFFGNSHVDPEENKHWQQFCYVLVLFSAPFAVLGLNMGLILISAVKYYYMSESYMDENSDCLWNLAMFPMVFGIIMTGANWVIQLALAGIVYNRLPNENRAVVLGCRIQACNTKHKGCCCSLVVLLILLTIGTWLNFVNLAIIASFTLVGLLFFRTDLILIFLASLLVIWHMIFKVGRINATISPGIAMCKASLDQASSELQAEAHKKATPTLLPPESTGKQSTQGKGLAVKKTCKYLNLPDVRMSALLKLCANHVPPGDDTTEDGGIEEGTVSITLGEPCDKEDLKTFKRLRSTIKNAFWKHIFNSSAKSCLLFFTIAIVQTILAHYDDLRGPSDIFKYVLPASALAKYLIDVVKARLPSSKGPNGDLILKAEATSILVELWNDRPTPPSTPQPTPPSTPQSGLLYRCWISIWNPICRCWISIWNIFSKGPPPQPKAHSSGDPESVDTIHKGLDDVKTVNPNAAAAAVGLGQPPPPGQAEGKRDSMVLENLSTRNSTM